MNVGDNPSRGLFINACYSHVFSESDELWNSNITPTLGNMVCHFDTTSVSLIIDRLNIILMGRTKGVFYRSILLCLQTIAQAVGDWFFDRRSVKLIDNQTDFPVNCPV